MCVCVCVCVCVCLCVCVNACVHSAIFLPHLVGQPSSCALWPTALVCPTWGGGMFSMDHVICAQGEVNCMEFC